MEQGAEGQHQPDVMGQAAAVPPQTQATVHEIRPVGYLKVCPDCLVQNTSENTFCTACGAALGATPAADPAVSSAVAESTVSDADTSVAVEPETQVIDAPAPPAETTAVLQPVVETAVPRAAPARSRRGRWIMLTLLVLAFAGIAVLAALWVMQRNHTHRLSRSLAATQATLAQTRGTLHDTQTQLAAATSLSNRRRAVLLQAKDVLAKVDPLLSSVDTIQSKAGSVGGQGSTLSSDSETFISTVSALVNYMLNNNAAYYDYNWMNQQIDAANAELATIRADEASFSDDTSAYTSASSGFGTKASAFTDSVRQLEQQLNTAVNK